MLLREKDKQFLIDLFSRLDIPVEVLAYGSRVDNTAHDGSILNLVIRAKDNKPLSSSMYSSLQVQITESNIPNFG